MAKNIEEVRADIALMYDKVNNESYYDVLGVEKDADKNQIMTAYRNLARTWHVDRFSMFDLGDDKSKLQHIFSEVNNAQRTLTTPDKREEYDAEMSGDSGATGADVVDIFNADKCFLRGKNFLQQGSYKGAHDLFVEAYALNAEDPDLYIHLLYTEYLLIPKNAEGKPHQITRASEIYEELEALLKERGEIDWLMVFLGTVGLGIGKDRQARSLFREVMLINPKNFEASRQLRLLEMRKDRKEDKGGFFDKIKAMFSK